MDRFLQKVARRIVDDLGPDIAQGLVVFNNHRSARFLQREFELLSAQSGTAFFLPHMVTIDDMVGALGGLEIVRNEFLLFELYQVHVEIGGPDRKYQRFEDFISFGDMMLSDFSEVDRYCIDAKNLFVNLSGVKEIELWNVERPGMTDFQRDYIQFYHSLYDYYSRFRQRLLEKGRAYSGMAYRKVADEIEDIVGRCPYRHVYFVGFNALSECELRIIGQYHMEGKGTLLTDGDAYYYDDKRNEAGLFLRDHSKRFPELVPPAESCFGMLNGRKVHIVECPEDVLQCKYAGQLLEENPGWLTDNNATAVVLADEGLLMPTLNSLPNVPVNVSMGYAYSDSNVHLLMLRLLALYRQHNDRGYYFREVVELLSHRLMARLIGNDNIRKDANRHVSKNKLYRFHADDVAMLTGSTDLSFLFPDEQPDVNGFFGIVERTSEMLLSSGTLENNMKERQALGALLEIVGHLRALQEEYSCIEPNALERIYGRLSRRYSITLYGEPLTGLQVLGMLETRNLDFKRVILLSANEGVLPAGRTDSTIIPYDIKRHFGLPTYEERDSVFAYHFYRLIQRAEEVYLIYSSESTAMGKGDPSRYVRQVQLELACDERFRGKVTVDHTVVDTNCRLTNGAVEEGQKTPKAMEQLYKMALKGFSPSALNDYNACPRKFYYERVLKVREDDIAEDEMDASEIGNLVHKVLQHIYEPCVGKGPVEAGYLKGCLDRVEETLNKAFDEEFKNGRTPDGRNRLAYSIVLTQLKSMLAKEIKEIEAGHAIEIISVEPEDSKPYLMFTTEERQEVNLTGRPDRIDRYDGMVRVIDYKTGAVPPQSLKNDKGKLPDKLFQLMTYALVYYRTQSSESLKAAIYPLRYLKSDLMPALWNGSEVLDGNALDAFETEVGDIIHSMLDPDAPFAATPSANACKYCAAKAFCPVKVESNW